MKVLWRALARLRLGGGLVAALHERRHRPPARERDCRCPPVFDRVGVVDGSASQNLRLHNWPS
jgi:hypothetical protein